MLFSNISYLYFTLLACGATLLFFFSFILLCSRLSSHQTDVQYMRSRNLLGYSFLTVGVDLILLWAAGPMNISAYTLFALHLMGVHLATVLLFMGYANLLDPSYITSRQMTRDLGCWVINAVLAWVAALFLTEVTQQVAIGVTVVIYVLEMVRMLLNLKAVSTHAQVELDNFFSEGAEEFLGWLRKSILLLCAAGLCTVALFFTPLWVHLIYMVILAALLVYAFLSFLNFVVKFHRVSTAMQQVGEIRSETSTLIPAVQPAESSAAAEPEPTVVSEEDKQPVEISTVVSREEEDKSSITERLLRENLDKWIMSAGYLQQATLEDLAAELMTNRTYLSAYINNTYNCTFKEFIYMLRIEAAIQIMMDEPNIGVEDLGTRVGIPSASTFNRQFVKQMGVTPAVWKMSNLAGRG